MPVLTPILLVHCPSAKTYNPGSLRDEGTSRLVSLMAKSGYETHLCVAPPTSQLSTIEISTMESYLRLNEKGAFEQLWFCGRHKPTSDFVAEMLHRNLYVDVNRTHVHPFSALDWDIAYFLGPRTKGEELVKRSEGKELTRDDPELWS